MRGSVEKKNVESCNQGIDATTWKKRFQFKPSDGLFEFREDQMLLDRGFPLTPQG